MKDKIRHIKDNFAKENGYEDYVDMIIKLTEKNKSMAIILVHSRIETLILNSYGINVL